MANVLDVVIVGAGLSGLQAALDLHDAGRSFVVLESRDRVGGKTHSVDRPDGKGRQELGAAWMNDTNQSYVWSYAKRFGLTPVYQNTQGSVASEDEDGNCRLFPFDGMPDFSKRDVDNIVDIRSKVEAASLDGDNFKQPKRGELDRITFEEWLRNAGAGKRALLTARVWCRGTLGQDPNEVSALGLLEIARGALGIINLRFDGPDGAQRLRIKEGTQSIAIGMVKLLPNNSIMLNSPVSSIIQYEPRLYTVMTTNGHLFRTRKVIVSIPTPAYRNIKFDPPLPLQKQVYGDTARYGCYVKYIAMFKSPFWRRVGACGLAQSFRGPINHCRDTSVDEQDNYALTCFVVSRPGRIWLTLGEREREEAALRQIASLFGVKYEAVKAEFVGSMTSEWQQDKWAGWGCPFVVTPPGSLVHSEDGALAGLKSGGLYFVGTEFTDEWRGYMDGALRSGARGATRVLKDLAAGDVSFLGYQTPPSPPRHITYWPIPGSWQRKEHPNWPHSVFQIPETVPHGTIYWITKGKQIGGGATAHVEQLPLGHIVKSPKLNPYSPKEEEGHRRDMRTEAEVYRRIEACSYIPRFIDWVPESCCLTLEYLEKGDLAMYMKQTAEIPAEI
ncbi:hypothetical protein ACHAPT_013557 [Fusarium lateritium]